MTRIAQGFARTDATRTIAVRFDQDTFEEIRQRAVTRNASFADEVRLLVEFGLEA